MSDLPWLMPWETVEALELMTETAACMRGAAEFSSMRKELRLKLQNQARLLEEFVRMYQRGIVDESLILGIDAMSAQRKRPGGKMAEIMEALENHVSAYNRRKA